MSAMATDEPAQDAPPPGGDGGSGGVGVGVGVGGNGHGHAMHQHGSVGGGGGGGPDSDTPRKPKAPSVRRACVACHSGKTRCSEVLPCQSCLKRGLGSSCAYPDPDAPSDGSKLVIHQQQPQPQPQPQQPPPPPPATQQIQFANPALYSALPTLSQQQYYDYNGQYTGASTSTFRPNKRPRNLTEEEAAAITRNFTRGDFYVGSSAPVRIDHRLPVRLTLGEGDHVHFTVGEPLV